MLQNLNLQNIGSAVLSGVIFAVLGYLGDVANILEVDPKVLLNVAVLAAVSSLLKALGTNSEGKFLGAIKVK